MTLATRNIADVPADLAIRAAMRLWRNKQHL
jgi:hypothetical protein